MLARDINTLLSNNDVEVVPRMYVLLYADDFMIMTENENELQAALNANYEYCNQWHLTAKIDKTKVVVFSRGKIGYYLEGSNWKYNFNIIIPEYYIFIQQL